MKRAALLATLLSLVVCGTAQARPWLTMHRAGHAATIYIGHWAERVNWTDCQRRGPRTILCLVDGTYTSGTRGPNLEVDGSQDAAGQEVQQYVLVRLAHGRVRVADADAPDS